jgi:uncharacterized membrane protein (UPF0182 family)
MNMRKSSLLFFFGAFFLLVISFSSIVAFTTDWWWFAEVGFTDVFITTLTAQLAVGFSIGLFTALFFISNVLIAAYAKVPWMATIPPALVGQHIIIYGRAVRILGIFVSLLVSFFVGLIASTTWPEVLKYLNHTPFGQTDPIFGKDISFYIFTLPIFSLGLSLVKFLTLFSAVACGLIYLIQGKINLAGILGKSLYRMTEKMGGRHKTTAFSEIDKKARIHLSILITLFLVALAGSTFLSMYSTLTTQNGPVFGTAFTDTTVTIPLLYLTIFSYGLAALMLILFGINGKITPFLGALVISTIISVATNIIPPVFQKLIVAPNELAKETPFIKHSIAATRDAYGLTDIERRQISASKPLTAEDITNNNLTIKNVRLWDRDPLLSTFSQLQEIRTYYEFASVDTDRYTIDNEIRQIMLSSRELSSASLPNKNWINEHLTFTHGYGIAAGPVNQVTPEGLPVLFVKDLPPKADKKELAVQRPEIYYGELVNEYVVVKSKSKEFDYPKGEDNVYVNYAGTGGVEIDSPLKRLLYTLHFSSLKFFLSDDITRESRIMYNREIKTRVQKIAPFLTYDGDPYLVVADGKLFWILDAYTQSARYPYSQQTTLNGRKVNYIRNSVKVTVDAYNGSVQFYQADENDPLIQTYIKIFPKTFHKLSEMPKSLLAHLRYPEDIFTLQTSIYTVYHMDDPQIFYNKEDQWEIPALSQDVQAATDTTVPTMLPRHMIMKLPGEEKEEFILMLPFTPRAKDNLSAWMVARNDGENYGKLVVYRFPKDKLIFGPKQIIGRISQDAEISRQISLWDQRGSTVIQGPLMVIPIEESLLYVRPLYLKADTGKIPELKRVIVAYENKIAMEETLEKGLARIFGGSTSVSPSMAQPGTNTPAAPTTTPQTETTNRDALIQQASDAYTAALDAQRNGDWTKYGEEIKKLGDLLQQIR